MGHGKLCLEAFREPVYTESMNTGTFLRKADFFEGISESARKKIAESGTVLKIRKRNLIFLEGDTGKEFYLLVEGAVRIFKTDQEGGDVTLKLLKAGEVFAETILFETDKYPASAEAVSDCRFFQIKREEFLDLLDDRRFRGEFIALLMRKQRYLTKRILQLTRFDVEERFFRFLNERYGSRESYRLGLSKRDIAAAVGTTPESLSRLLNRLKARGVIDWEGNLLTIHAKPDIFDNPDGN